MYCPRCGHQIAGAGRYCGQCGEPLAALTGPAYCGQCGSPRPAAAQFCGSCGAALPPVARARLAASPRLELASVENRLLARALDLGILVALYIVAIVVLAGLSVLSLFGFLVFPLFPVLVLMALPLAYEAFFWMQYDGATPGKMATNIKVVRSDGSPISVEQALGRSAFYTYIPFMPFIVLITVLADPGRRGLHDIVADTVVVRSR